MANGLNMHELAREGAAVRLQHLRSEITAIKRAFPTITTGTNGFEVTPRRQSGMSTKSRKAQSIRMKAYWKARRKEAS